MPHDHVGPGGDRAGDGLVEDDRVAMSKEAFKKDFLNNLFCVLGKIPALATQRA